MLDSYWREGKCTTHERRWCSGAHISARTQTFFRIAKHNNTQINYNACNWNQAPVNTVIDSYDYDYSYNLTPVAANKNSSVFTAAEIVFLASSANVKGQTKVVLHMACRNPTFMNTLSFYCIHCTIAINGIVTAHILWGYKFLSAL